MSVEKAVNQEIYNYLQKIEDEMQKQILPDISYDGWERAIKFLNMYKNKSIGKSNIWDEGLTFKNKDFEIMENFDHYALLASLEKNTVKARKENYQHWHETVINLHNTGLFSWREISRLTGVCKSTCSDFLRKATK